MENINEGIKVAGAGPAMPDKCPGCKSTDIVVGLAIDHTGIRPAVVCRACKSIMVGMSPAEAIAIGADPQEVEGHIRDAEAELLFRGTVPVGPQVH